MEDRVAYWKAKADGLVHCGAGDFGRNQLITKAYASIYLERPDAFKWAGMAAFASAIVGYGIAAGKFIDITVNVKNLGNQNIRERQNTIDLDNLLSLGNVKVYDDLYWQHLMFMHDGNDALQSVLSEIVIENKRASTLIQGWNSIAEGLESGDENKVWRGNQELLRYEQMITLQPIYDRYRRLADQLSWFMISPLPSQIASFKQAYPGHSIASFDARWLWIENYLIPHWRVLDMRSRIAPLSLTGVSTLTSLYGYALTPRSFVCTR